MQQPPADGGLRPEQVRRAYDQLLEVARQVSDHTRARLRLLRDRFPADVPEQVLDEAHEHPPPRAPGCLRDCRPSP